jgi:phenylalanyl-tRNA synthetase beta chain
VFQRDRRLLKEVLCGLGCSEAWTSTFVSEADQRSSGVGPPYIEVTNPLVEAERFLRSSMMPGLLRAVLYNVERRQHDIRLFEVGSVFHRLVGATEDAAGRPPAVTTERLSVVFAADGDDAWTAVAAWRIVAEALGVAEWSLDGWDPSLSAASILHPYRSSVVMGREPERSGPSTGAPIGLVGELDPSTVGSFGLLGPDGRPRRVGWLDLDVGMLLDAGRLARRPDRSSPISRFPSSDIDLAFVVADDVPAGSVALTLGKAGGDELESVDLFDVYRGPSVEVGSRGLAYRLRFCALDRTLTDEEIGTLRTGCIDAVESEHRARLR